MITYSGYTNPVNIVIPSMSFTLSSTGDGSGVSTLTIRTFYNTVVILTGNAKFYTDLVGTLNESSTWNIASGANRTIYLKGNSSDSTLIVPNNNLSYFEIGGTTNCVIIDGDITNMKYVTRFNVIGKNTLYGDITEFIDATYIQLVDNEHITGNISGLINLGLIVTSGFDDLTGDISNLVNLTQLETKGLYCTVSGSITGFTKLVVLEVGGLHTCSGHTQFMPDLSLIRGGGGTIDFSKLIYNTKLGVCQIGQFVQTSALVNQILSAFWANKDYAKGWSERLITLNNINSGAPTGQGIIDKAALQAYRSPNNNGAYSLWIVTTN